jgi:hypothetical protein
VIFIGSALAFDGLERGLRNPRSGTPKAADNLLIHLSFAEAFDSSKGVYQAGEKVNSKSLPRRRQGRTPKAA